MGYKKLKLNFFRPQKNLKVLPPQLSDEKDKMTATEMKNTTMDAKREEFRKYLEKEGVLEFLTNSLVALYEEGDKPTSALDFLKNNVAGKEVEETKQKFQSQQSQIENLKKTVERLETENLNLKSKVTSLEKQLEEAPKNEAEKAVENIEEQGSDDEKVAANVENGKEKTQVPEEVKETESVPAEESSEANVEKVAEEE